jgi:hypothetical protein
MVAKLLFFRLESLSKAIRWGVHEVSFHTHIPYVPGKLLQLQVQLYPNRLCVELVISEGRCPSPPDLLHMN